KLGTLDLSKKDTFNGQIDENNSNQLKEISKQLSEKAPLLLESITVKIPSDYKTLQEAINHLSGFKVSQGVVIRLLIEKGYNPDAGLIVNDGDYSHFVIESEDKEV